MAVIGKGFLKRLVPFFPAFLIFFASVLSVHSLEVGSVPQTVTDGYLPEGDGVTVKAWISGLEAPWSLVFLPDGRALVSERPGRIRLIKKGALVSKPYALPVVAGPDGYLYFLTNNRDGRGRPQQRDDHIYRIEPK